MRHINILMFFTLSLSASDMRALLFNGNCITCHEKQRSISAPSITLIKENYLIAFPVKKDFVEFMSKWVKKPNSETSIMQNSIQKHGLMPDLGYDISTLNEISSYIYDTNF